MQQQELKLFEERQILSVSQVVHGVKVQLETKFQDIWVRGEISNFRTPSSGHQYFTLKDTEAQIRAVCFRLQNRVLKFRPEDGLDVIARGSVSVYPPRGEFQLVVETMEPVGPGALQLAFEQLKTRLESEGLFDQAHKKNLPLLPSKIGIVTSPTGAAIQDILRVLSRRNDRLNVLIFPAKVQGSGASAEVAQGIEYLNTREDIDVIILARGGGSLEDLWAFNEETLARVIFNSRIPVISAVGHEIDFTIADFVADLRAATPSAAAEIVSGAREELCSRIESLTQRTVQALRLSLKDRREKLRRLASSRAFVDAESKLRFFLQRLDELYSRLVKTIPSMFSATRQEFSQHELLLRRQIQFYLQSRKHVLTTRSAQLQAYSPLAVLERGYAIVTTKSKDIVRDPNQVKKGDRVDIRVERGQFRAQKV
ncbi:exodeoxyribonuclease VII large subunit [Acidobacteria bacterium AH-259-D05]|nr:exodeoxyribonuclease VII large subunit [Acidobacteria bacterium AH-259-D05]